MKITVDIDEINLIAGEADKLLIEKKTEDGLSKLLTLRDQIEKAIDEAQKMIEKKGLSVNPNFKSVEGDLIKASYRAYGQKYYLEEDKINEVPTEMFTKEIITKYKVNSKVVDNWLEKNKGLPYGIVAPERVKSLKIMLKNHDTTKD